MHISLPQPLKQWVDQQVQQKGFGTASEFVRDMLRRQQEQEVRARVDQKLIDALDAGPFTAMNKKEWQELRREARKRVAAANRKKS